MDDVVHVHHPQPHVAVVELADRANSNLLTKPLVQGLGRAFVQFGREPDLRVVVLHGYDSFFCTGGTKEDLVGVYEGKIHFDDVPLYRILLDCEVPVISAMQGHALGGGFAIGMYADLVIFAEESLYGATFMKYGFTPGMGATLVLPTKLGLPLATEMLMTARRYHGGQLRDWGVPFPVVKRQQVIPMALALANEIADKPTLSLKLLKRTLTARLREELPQTIETELLMQKQCFAQPEVRQRIETWFGK